MLKLIGDKEDSMDLSALSLFNHLCLALSLDMQSLKDKKVKTYDA